MAVHLGRWHFGTLLVAGIVLLYANRNQWFFGDEWDFIAERGALGEPDRGLFAPHNEHWSTLPILVYRALLATVGLHHYWPYIVVLILLHLAAAHLIWRQLTRMGVSAHLATAGVGVFLVLGAGSENLLWAFQIGFVGSVALGWAHITLANSDQSDPRRTALAWAAGVAALMCSGIGVVMVAVATLTALLRRGWGAAVVHVSVPAVAFAVWFLLAGRDASASPPHPGTVRFVLYLGYGLVNALGQSAGWRWLGAPMLLGLVIGAWRLRNRRTGPEAAAYAGLLGFVLQFAVAAWGRGFYGLSQATAPRYAYIGMALALPFTLLALDRALRRGPTWAPGVATVLLLLPFLSNLVQLRTAAGLESGREQALRGVILAAVPLVQNPDTTFVRTEVEPLYSPNLTVAGLRQLAREGVLPTESVTAEQTLTSRANLQSLVKPSPDGLIPGTATVSQAVRLTQEAVSDACATFRPTESDSPQLVVSTMTGEPETISLRPSQAGNLLVFFSGVVPGQFGSPAIYPLSAGSAYTLQITAPEQAAVVTLPAGSTEVCAGSLPVFSSP